MPICKCCSFLLDVNPSKRCLIHSKATSRNCGHDFITGILSKQKGQALCVAVVMNALFSLDDKYKLKALIDEDAVKAAIDFVQVCGDHASLLSGRRRLVEVVAAMDTSKVLSQMHVSCLELLTCIIMVIIDHMNNFIAHLSYF